MIACAKSFVVDLALLNLANNKGGIGGLKKKASKSAK